MLVRTYEAELRQTCAAIRRLEASELEHRQGTKALQERLQVVAALLHHCSTVIGFGSKGGGDGVGAPAGSSFRAAICFQIYHFMLFLMYNFTVSDIRGRSFLDMHFSDIVYSVFGYVKHSFSYIPFGCVE